MTDTTVQTNTEDTKTCLHCNQAIAAASRFCRHCGSSQRDGDFVVTGSLTNISHIAILFGADLTICLIAKLVDDVETLSWSVIFDVTMAAVAIIFFCSNWKQNRVILKWPRFSIAKLLGYCGAAIIASLIVSFCMTWLNHALFSKEFYYYGLYADQKYAALLMIASIALMPALFEELAYRGYVLQNLLGLTDTNQAVFISSFLFAILHLSFLSLVWLVPFALALGYVRVKEKTLWYGVFMHFCFNLTVCLMELWKYA